jgi:hypothetical protein
MDLFQIGATRKREILVSLEHSTKEQQSRNGIIIIIISRRRHSCVDSSIGMDTCAHGNGPIGFSMEVWTISQPGALATIDATMCQGLSVGHDHD